MFLNAENSLFYAFIYQIKYVNPKCVKLLFLHGMLEVVRLFYLGCI